MLKSAKPENWTQQITASQAQIGVIAIIVMEGTICGTKSVLNVILYVLLVTG
jgi:hypothetical protein